ncbi:MAG: diacylglycerol kinase family protein, partial [Ruminococcus sp.]|nr:diacylglycerol kinase family protein [Ruminococcus sp.]
MKTYVLYNKLSNNGKGQTTAEQLKTHWANRELTFVNARELDDYAGFFAGLQPDDEVCVCGGDGTLNYLINHVDCDSLTNKIFYFPAGSGNDFWTDLGKKPGDAPAQINRYIKNLPTVTVKGKTSKFINGVGYGIDGYCCEEGDRLREKSDKPINYTSIAIKGLLFRYKPTNAEV